MAKRTSALVSGLTGEPCPGRSPRGARSIAWLLATLCFAPTASGEATVNRVYEALVKIETTMERPNERSPWSSGSIDSGTGSGCILEGRRILTNAHVVSHQTMLQVKRQGQTKKFDARILYISHEADLALLTVDDPAFFEGVLPLRLGGLPSSEAQVLVLGFPAGGESLSTTKGVISRVEHTEYVHSGLAMLAGQIDAAVNPGNSGGPVIVDGRVVGVVMQSYTGLTNTAYMIPAPVITRFMDDVADGRYDGIPRLGLTSQAVENPALKRQYGVPPGDGGLVVRRVLPGSSAAAGGIRPGDVIAEIAGAAIAYDGTIEFRKGGRTDYTYSVQGRQRGEEIDLIVIRDRQRLRIRLPLRSVNWDGELIAARQYDTRPSYFFFGGLLLRSLTLSYIESWGDEWWRNAPANFRAAMGRVAAAEGEEIVVLAKVLPDELNQGYHTWSDDIVSSVDGERILNLRELVRRIESGTGEFLTLELEDGRKLILDRTRARDRSAAILERYHIPKDRSPDLASEAAKE